MQMKHIEIGSRFYCKNNRTYITVDGVGCDPQVYDCVVEEMNDQGEYEITGRGLYTRGELLSARWQEVA